LRNLFPSNQYHFEKSDTVAQVTFAVESLRNLTWLGGQGYDLAALYVQGVCYKCLNSQTRKGIYCPVMFENLADPIITGREELGIPKLFSDIEIRSDASKFRADISWRGARWATMEIQDLRPSTDAFADYLSEGLLVHKYIPSANLAKPDADYNIMHPPDGRLKPTSALAANSSNGTLKINDLGPKSLPTLHPIVSRLAELPVFEVVQASVVEYDGIPDLSRQEHLS
jgi:acetoacetate decarboxylase